MHGGAVTLARKFNNMKWGPDLILATDMLDLTTFLSLTREKSHNIPTAIYFMRTNSPIPGRLKIEIFKKIEIIIIDSLTMLRP